MAILNPGPNEEAVANYMRQGAYGNPRSKGWYGQNIVTVYAPNGVPFAVHKDAAPGFQGFVNDLANSGYQIRPTDSGGYNLRTKRGGTSLSQHAFGNGIDINWSSNPMQKKLQTDMPDNITEMAAKWGLEWGGNWKGAKDAMHFEWTGVPVMPGVGALRSPEAIKNAQQALAAQGLYDGEIDGVSGPMMKQALANYAQVSGVMTAGANAMPLPDYSQSPQTAQSAIAGLVDPGGGTQVAEAPSPLMSFAGAPEMGIGPPPAPPPQRPPMLTPPQWAQNGAFPMAGAASTDAMVGGPMPPTPRLRDQSVLEQQRADQLDAALFGAGPHRGDFARGRPSDVFQINPVSGAPDAATVPGPNASPLRPAVGGPNDRRPQPPMPNVRPAGRYVAGAGGAPVGPPDPRSNPRRDPFGFPIDVNRPRINNPDGSFSTERTTTFDAAEVGLPSEIVTVPTIVNGRQVSEDEARALFASGQNPPVQRGFVSFGAADVAAEARTGSIAAARATNGERGFPTAYGEQPQPPVPYVPMVAGRPEFPGALPAASRTGDMSAAMGGPPAPPDPLAGFGTRDLAAETQAIRTIANANYYRPQNIMAPPPLAGGMSAAMGGPPAPPPPPDFTAASDPAPALTLNDPYANQRRPSSFETAQQNFQMPEGWTPGGDAPPPPAMFNPPYNQAAEWFKGNTPGYTDTAFNNAPLPPPPTPTPTAPQGTPSTWGKGLPLPSFMSQDQFNVSFAPGGPGVIADLNAPSQPEPATAAQGNPFDALLGPGAAMAAIPFNDASQGVGSPDFSNARAASVWDSRAPGNLGLDGPTGGTVAPPSPASWAAGMDTYVQNRFSPSEFAGGSVVRPPTPVPGTPGVVQGAMPGAMDIRPPAQGGPPLPPQALPQASPAPAPRQTNVGAERQRSGTLGRILGGLLGGPVGALGGGLLGGGGGGIFGGGSVTPMGASFSSPYMQPNGQMGSTNVQRIQSGNMQGTAWNRNGGGSVGYVTDPFTGSMIYTSSSATY